MVGKIPYVRFGVWVDVYSSSNYAVSRYENKDIFVQLSAVTQIPTVVNLGPARVEVRSGRGGMRCTITVGGSASGVTAFGIVYSINDAGGEIVTKSGEHFLTDKNIGQYLGDGKGYTGHISIEFAFNNIQRNYNFDFVNGVLVNHQLLTPTSPNFRV